MTILYGSLLSRSNRNAWMLKELGVAFEHVPTNFTDGSTHTPEFLKINPNGRVPALDDDGLKLFESLAINLYLARKHGGPVAPQTLEEEALATQWSFWALSEIEKPLLLAAANLALFDAEKRKGDEAAVALKKLARPWGVLERHLADRSFILGERFTVADINVAGVMSLVPTAGIDTTPWPPLHRWLHACLDRPAACDCRDVRFSIPRPPSELGMLAMFV